MKRSLINAIIHDAEAFIQAHQFHLPPFAHWSVEEWQQQGPKVSAVIERGLGWDITDFGLGAFRAKGLVLFTIRNGRPENLHTCQGKVYAEKLLIVDVDQLTPLHFHWAKTEDIINRGGGRLAVQLYNATDGDGLDTTGVVAEVDSVPRRVEAGGIIILQPGESITLTPRLYHAFWGLDQRVLVGEVSSVNDDAHDNRFYEPVGRFPDIDEDEPLRRLLIGDYTRFLSGESWGH